MLFMSDILHAVLDITKDLDMSLFDQDMLARLFVSEDFELVLRQGVVDWRKDIVIMPRRTTINHKEELFDLFVPEECKLFIDLFISMNNV